MEYVKTIDNNIDHELLYTEVKQLLGAHNLWDQAQVSLTSVDGNDDWACTVGKIHLLKYPERYYSTVNHSLKDLYIAELIARYKDFYRWRLLRLDGRSCYSIHSDRNAGELQNVRLHIPVHTNPHAFLCFYDSMPQAGTVTPVTYEHLAPGASYRVNTTGLHTAINHSTQYRYHIVGVKYEKTHYE